MYLDKNDSRPKAINIALGTVDANIMDINPPINTKIIIKNISIMYAFLFEIRGLFFILSLTLLDFPWKNSKKIGIKEPTIPDTKISNGQGLVKENCNILVILIIVYINIFNKIYIIS